MDASKVDAYSVAGYDRDAARAIFAQAASPRFSRLDETQVLHLLTIGYRAGHREATAIAAHKLREMQAERRGRASWRAFLTGIGSILDLTGEATMRALYRTGRRRPRS